MGAIDLVDNEKASVEKQDSLLRHHLSETNRLCEETNLSLSDNSGKEKNAETMKLLRGVGELDKNKNEITILWGDRC